MVKSLILLISSLSLLFATTNAPDVNISHSSEFVTYNELEKILTKQYLKESKELRNTYSDMFRYINYFFAILGITATVALGIYIFIGYRTQAMINTSVKKATAGLREGYEIELKALLEKEQKEHEKFFDKLTEELTKKSAENFNLLSNTLDDNIIKLLDSNLLSYNVIFEEGRLMEYQLYKKLAMDTENDNITTFAQELFIVNNLTSFDESNVLKAIDMLSYKPKIMRYISKNLILHLKERHNKNKEILSFLSSWE